MSLIFTAFLLLKRKATTILTAKSLALFAVRAFMHWTWHILLKAFSKSTEIIFAAALGSSRDWRMCCHECMRKCSVEVPFTPYCAFDRDILLFRSSRTKCSKTLEKGVQERFLSSPKEDGAEFFRMTVTVSNFHRSGQDRSRMH